MGPRFWARAGKRIWAGAVLVLGSSSAHALWLGSRSRSRWLDRRIVVDGADDDWSSQEGDESEGLTFAFANDAKDLYILVSPHTRSNRDQLGGAYGQDFIVWVDSGSGRTRGVGLRLRGPQPGAGASSRALEIVGRDAAAVSAAKAEGAVEARIGAVQERGGAFEARYSLRLLGSPRPKKVFVGLSASPGRFPAPSPAQDPAPGAKQPRREGPIEPINFWIQVTLADPPAGK